MIRTGVTLNVTRRSAFVRLPVRRNVTFPIANVTLNTNAGLSERSLNFFQIETLSVSTHGVRLTTYGIRCTVCCIRYVISIQ